jgi:DNA-binding NtrC family response regulator
LLAPEAVEAMQRYTWPGNVRELENALERAVILAKGDTIPLSALPERVVEPKSDPLVSDAVQSNPTLDTVERAYILWVLETKVETSAHGGSARHRSLYSVSQTVALRPPNLTGFWEGLTPS